MTPLTTNDVIDLASGRLRRLMDRAPGVFPTYTAAGRWVTDDDPWAPSWSGGFMTGMMWLLADALQDEWWRDQARAHCRLLESRRFDKSTHDIGFIFEPSWGRWFDVDPSDLSRSVIIDAGRTMADRFQPAGRYFCSWVDPGSTFIDIMMNLGIVFRAAELSGDEQMYERAVAHAHTSMRHLQRGDGSVIHEGWFDVTTGEFLRADTHQGWRADSSWARGLAWAIYGFADTYAHTGLEEFLAASRHAADYYIALTGDAFIPPNDWLDPRPPAPWESSAAAISAAGMLRLDRVSPARSPEHREYATGIVKRLMTPDFLDLANVETEGLITHAMYHQRNGLGVDASLMWGDHYFLEALLQVGDGA